LGVSEQDLNAERNAVSRLVEARNVWEENWTTLLVFLDLHWERVVYPGRCEQEATRSFPVGVQTAEIESVMRIYRVPLEHQLEMLGDVHAMVRAALPILHKQVATAE
jgi:hypothetical protein